MLAICSPVLYQWIDNQLHLHATQDILGFKTQGNGGEVMIIPLSTANTTSSCDSIITTTILIL